MLLGLTHRRAGEHVILDRSSSVCGSILLKPFGASIWMLREEQVDRSQEIALFATTTTASRQELIRQQWVFGASGSTTEMEDFAIGLRQVTLLELEIDPGRHDKNVGASLQAVQIG
jgi:hypothetical protein